MNSNEVKNKSDYNHGNWVLINFVTRGVWVSEDTDILYKGYKFVAVSAEKDQILAVAIKDAKVRLKKDYKWN